MILEFSLYRKRGTAFWGAGQSRNILRRALLGQKGELSTCGWGICRRSSWNCITFDQRTVRITPSLVNLVSEAYKWREASNESMDEMSKLDFLKKE